MNLYTDLEPVTLFVISDFSVGFYSSSSNAYLCIIIWNVFSFKIQCLKKRVYVCEDSTQLSMGIFKGSSFYFYREVWWFCNFPGKHLNLRQLFVFCEQQNSALLYFTDYACFSYHPLPPLFYLAIFKQKQTEKKQNNMQKQVTKRVQDENNLT